MIARVRAFVFCFGVRAIARALLLRALVCRRLAWFVLDKWWCTRGVSYSLWDDAITYREIYNEYLLSHFLTAPPRRKI